MGRHEVLTSPANPMLKDVRRAITRGGLTDDGYMVAETFHLLAAGLNPKNEVQDDFRANDLRQQGDGIKCDGQTSPARDRRPVVG